jgi:hypothetical protein
LRRGKLSLRIGEQGACSSAGLFFGALVIPSVAAMCTRLQGVQGVTQLYRDLLEEFRRQLTQIDR